jgi:hypothetical protein
VCLHALAVQKGFIVNIKFVPQDKKWPADRAVMTNVGEFKPGQILSMADYQEKEAKRLIENGDFVESPDAPPPDSPEAAKPAPELQEEIEEQFSGKKSKK